MTSYDTHVLSESYLGAIPLFVGIQINEFIDCIQQPLCVPPTDERISYIKRIEGHYILLSYMLTCLDVLLASVPKYLPVLTSSLFFRKTLQGPDIVGVESA